MSQVDRRQRVQLLSEELALLKSCGSAIRRTDCEALALALVPEGRVRMDRRENEGFRARICGFAPGEPWFDGVRARDVEHQARAPVSSSAADGRARWAAICACAATSTAAPCSR
jgi:hypothetical protein